MRPRFSTGHPVKSMYFWLSRTQAAPGRTVKQEQEDISRNHVQTFSGCSVHRLENFITLKLNRCLDNFGRFQSVLADERMNPKKYQLNLSRV